MSTTSAPIPASEGSVIFIVGAVQFINILDFMMVSPLGPFLARALNFPLSHAAWATGSYTAAAAVSGLAGAFFLDRFERKRALFVAMLGLALGTLAGGFAVDLRTLLFARVLAGLFGGPATSLAFSIVADVVPPERRGKALGKVMGAFAAASVLGVPFGLELARRFDWRMPFVSTAALGAAAAFGALLRLPTLRGHLALRADRSPLRELGGLVRADVLLSYGMTAIAMMASFILLPNVSSYLVGNLRYPPARLGLLYMAGGVVSFFTSRATGKLIDRFGSARVGAVGTLLLSGVILVGFTREPPCAPILAIFIGVMFAMSIRNLAYSTLTSKVPRPGERAAFMSVQSSVQHLASAAGAICSSFFLTERADKALAGFPSVAAASIAVGLFLLPMLWIVEARVKQRVQLPPIDA